MLNSIDVFVELQDGFTYNVIVSTPKNLEAIMNGTDVAFANIWRKVNYFRPGPPFIIVKKWTKDIIEEALTAYAQEDDGYWLKFYYFSDEMNKTVFDELKAEHIKYLK
jgi:YHS domain-containing protein